MYSTLKPTIRFTRNTRCPCSNDCDDHGDFFSRHKAGPPDEPSVDGRWCNVQHQEHMTVLSTCTQNNMWIRHSSYSATFKSTSSPSPKILKTLLRMLQVLTVFQIDVVSHLYTMFKLLTSASAINVFHPAGRERISATAAHDVTTSV